MNERDIKSDESSHFFKAQLISNIGDFFNKLS
jgi:hypothetical protein